jgi:hypothetical protein
LSDQHRDDLDYGASADQADIGKTGSGYQFLAPFQEQSAYNGHFESMCYHPLLLFSGEGDCLGTKLPPGNVHSAENWEKVLFPEIERHQQQGKDVVFRADAAFAKPEIYETLEEH